MSLKFALLGLLSQSPRHGYELKQQLETHFSGLRPVNTGQIYVSLARITREGLVSCETVEQKNSPARKIYTLTPSGQQTLLTWLAQPVEDEVELLRNEFFTRLLVHALVIGSQTDAESTTGIFKKQQEQFQTRLSSLKQQRRRLAMHIGPGVADPRPAAEQERSEIQLLLLEGAILHTEADLQWLELIEKRLKYLLHQRTPSPGN